MTDHAWTVTGAVTAAVCALGAVWVVGQAMWRYGPRGRRKGRDR